METVDVPDTRQDIKLFTKLNPGGQTDSVIPLRWSISAEAIEEIVSRGLRSPHMLISVESEGSELQRYVVPLKREMAYVTFSRSGKNVIHAAIVGSQGSEASAPKVLLSKSSRNSYEVWVLDRFQPLANQKHQELQELEQELSRLQDDFDPEGDSDVEVASQEAEELRAKITRTLNEFWFIHEGEAYQAVFKDEFDEISRLSYEAQMEVNVPKEMFAEKPEWMTKIADIYSWDHRLGDQCDLRRRVLITLLTLPFYWLFLAGMFIWALLAGVFVLTFGLIAGWRGANLGYLRNPSENDIGEIWAKRKPSFWLYRKVQEGSGRVSYEPRFPEKGGTVSGPSEANPEQDRRMQEAMRRELAALAEERNRNADVSDLKRPSVDLLFQDVKSKVCRPFER